MQRPFVPLRVYLLLLVLGAMLPGAVLTGILLVQAIGGNRAVIERRLQDTARVDAAAIDREFDAAIRALEALATSPSLSAGDLAAFHDEARRVQRTQRGWLSVLLLATDGQQLVNSRLTWGTPLASAHEPESVRDVVAQRRPVVGAVTTAPPGSSQYGFAVRVPVMRQQAVAYVLSAVIETASLSRLVDTRLPATEEWTRTILDAKATIAARSRDAARFVGQPATPSFRERLLTGTTEVFPERSIDGNPVYAALARSASGWTAAVVLPRSVLDAPVRGSTLALLTGGALLMLGTLAALLLISRRLSRDLDDVAGAAEALASGRPIHVRAAHVAETGRLQDSLRAAAVLLDSRQRERDEEVQRAQLARREAEHANQTKDQFLAILGHELRNPLAPALTALELMKRRDPRAFAREREVLERQVGHMARLVNDLLDVASLERGKITLKKTRLELRHIVDRAVDMARPLIERHGHALRIDVPPTGLPIDGDEDRLVQVLANLLTNAAKYTAPGGHIQLLGHADDGWAVFACEDDGPGVDDGLLASLFDPFEQGPRSLDRAQGGLGLGLALARRLTMLHGGTIQLERPVSGRGSRFVVRLPLAIGAPSVVVDCEAPTGVTASGARRVLVVDDNADATDMLRDALERAGHTVATALDGPAAITTAATFGPEVGVLDIGLPGMDGYELARHLRRSYPRMQLIALTGYGQPADVQAAWRAGFDRHCTKPVQIAGLLEQIDAACA